MDGQSETKKSKTGLIVGIVVGVLLIVGIGGYFIFQSMVNTPKNSYLLSEKADIDNTFEIFEERFSEELEWYEYMQANPVQTDLNITASSNDPSLQQMGLSELISGSEINISTGTDMEEEISTFALSADVAGFSVDGLDLFLTGNNAGITFPFIEEYLTLNEADAPGLLSMMDPAFNEEEEIDYSVFFDDQMLSETEREYIEDEYMSYIHDQLPDDAFESENEEITVGENTINAEKLTMNLSEEQIHTFISDLFNKMADDEELINMIQAQVTASSIGMPQDEADQIGSNVSDSLRTAAEDVQNVGFPDGLSSVIWLDGDDIVQRDLNVTTVNNDTTATVNLNGTNEISENGNVMNYNAVLGDGTEEMTFTINADLNEVENGFEDTITLSTSEADSNIVLTSTKDNSGDAVSSTLQLDVPMGQGMENLSIFLESESTYEDDQVTADYTIYAEDGVSITRDTATLNIAQESVTVDSVSVPDLTNEVNIGQMSEEELNDYFTNTFGPAFDSWVNENFGGMEPGSF